MQKIVIAAYSCGIPVSQRTLSFSVLFLWHPKRSAVGKGVMKKYAYHTLFYKDASVMAYGWLIICPIFVLNIFDVTVRIIRFQPNPPEGLVLQHLLPALFHGLEGTVLW